MLLMFFVFTFSVSAASCTFNDTSTGKSYSGECRPSTPGCNANELSRDDSTGACTAGGVGLWDCCVPNTTAFFCSTGGEGICKSACESGDTPVSGSDGQCASLTITKGKCCKSAPNSTPCTGKDASGTMQTGSCSTSATCSSGTALTGASGCAANGVACCYTPSGGGGGDGGTATTCSGSENPGIVPCGRSCDNPATSDDETKICTLCHLLILIQNITNWILMVMTYIAFAVLVAMGILYIVSTGKPQLTGLAKSGIWAALVGLAIVLLGWVAINVILMVLADGTLGSDTASFSIKTNGSWFTYSCDTQTKYTGTGGTGGTGGSGGGGGDGGSGGGPGNGSCSVITSGYCTTENLGKACSWNAEAASKVCNVESGGNTAAASNTDRCQNESGDRFSFGLFQLNIIANGCMLGSDCCWQNVFSLENGSAGNNGGAKKRCTNSKGVTYVCGWGCSVINRAKYTECSQRAMDAAKNISAACTLYKQSGWGPWPVTKKRCGL